MPPETKRALRARLDETRNTLQRQELLKKLRRLELQEAEKQAAATSDTPNQVLATVHMSAASAAFSNS